MKRDEQGITEVLSQDASIMKQILQDPNLISNLVKSITTALLNTYDFAKNAMLKGALSTALSDPLAVQRKLTGSKVFTAEYLARITPYIKRVDFILNLEDKDGLKTLDSFAVWESVDAASDNFSDWIIGQIYDQIGLSPVGAAVNYTMFDLYDLLAYKYN